MYDEVLYARKEGNIMKKVLKKKIKASSNAVRYFSGELVKYTKPESFDDGTTGRCTYTCG